MEPILLSVEVYNNELLIVLYLHNSIWILSWIVDEYYPDYKFVPKSNRKYIASFVSHGAM